MPARAPSPSAQWRETPGSGAALLLTRLFFSDDPITGGYTLSEDPSTESARLADVGGTGTFTLTPLGSIPSGTTVRRLAQRGTVVLPY